MDLVKQHGAKVVTGAGLLATVAVAFMSSDQINFSEHWLEVIGGVLGCISIGIGATLGVIKNKKGGTPS